MVNRNSKIDSAQSGDNVRDVSRFNLKQKFEYLIKCLTGKPVSWENKIKNSGSVLDRRVVFAKKENRESKVNKEIDKLTEKYGEIEAEGINSAREKLKSKNPITRNKGFQELRKIEKSLIKNAKNGALAKLPTFSGEQIGKFSHQLMAGIRFAFQTHQIHQQKDNKSNDVTWETGDVANDGYYYSLVASKEAGDGKKVKLEDMQFENTDCGIVAQFKDPYDEENIITIPIQETGAGRGVCPPELESYIKSEGGTYSLIKSDDGMYSLSEGEGQILQKCQQLIKGSVEGVRTEYGDELAKNFNLRLNIRLNLLGTSGDLSVKDFKRMIDEEKKNFVKVSRLGYEVQSNVPAKA